MVLFFLVIVAVIAVHFLLDGAIKKGVETVGPELTKVTVTLDSASVFLLSGTGSLKGMVIGNPDPFKAPFAISLGLASLSIKPSSLLTDKVVIEFINVQAPQIAFETDLRANNLKKILANIESATAGDQKTPSQEKSQPGKPAKKFQVNDFLMKGGRINVSVSTMVGAKSTSIALPEIHLHDLGTGPDGITVGELAKLILSEIEKVAVTASAQTVADLASGATVFGKDLSKSAGGAATNATDKVTKGIGDLFKKK